MEQVERLPDPGATRIWSASARLEGILMLAERIGRVP